MKELLDEIKKNTGIRTRIALSIFRLGFLCEYKIKNKILKNVMLFFYYLLKILSNLFYFGEIPPKKVFIDWGLYVPHGFQGIEINYRTRIGKNCTLFHNTTIGTIDGTGKHAVIGNNVYIGSNCLIIGDVEIGDNCKVGAGTRMLNQKVPKNSTIVNPIEYKILVTQN